MVSGSSTPVSFTGQSQIISSSVSIMVKMYAQIVCSVCQSIRLFSMTSFVLPHRSPSKSNLCLDLYCFQSIFLTAVTGVLVGSVCPNASMSCEINCFCISSHWSRLLSRWISGTTLLIVARPSHGALIPRVVQNTNWRKEVTVVRWPLSNYG